MQPGYMECGVSLSPPAASCMVLKFTNHGSMLTMCTKALCEWLLDFIRFGNETEFSGRCKPNPPLISRIGLVSNFEQLVRLALTVRLLLVGGLEIKFIDVHQARPSNAMSCSIEQCVTF